MFKKIVAWPFEVVATLPHTCKEIIQLILHKICIWNKVRSKMVLRLWTSKSEWTFEITSTTILNTILTFKPSANPCIGRLKKSSMRKSTFKATIIEFFLISNRLPTLIGCLKINLLIRSTLRKSWQLIVDRCEKDLKCGLMVVYNGLAYMLFLKTVLVKAIATVLVNKLSEDNLHILPTVEDPRGMV